MPSPREDGFVKVIVPMENHWSKMSGEGMWATPLGENLYEIENIPFYTYDLDYRDVVLAIEEDSEKWPTFVRVVKPSGHRSLRIFFKNGDDAPTKDRVLARLEAMDVGWEGANKIYYALSVPPEVPLDDVIAFLEDEEFEQRTLEYETAWDKRSPQLH